MRPPTEKEFHEWLLHPETQAFRQGLELGLEELRHQWAAGKFQRDADPHATAIANAIALAQVQLTERWVNVDYEQFIAGLEEIEHDIDRNDIRRVPQ